MREISWDPDPEISSSKRASSCFLLSPETEEKQRILVYVQAIPASVSTSAKRFTDLESSDFKMSHSSKAALAFASTHTLGEVVAAGFPPILREAVARGASATFSMPLCDDPLKQLDFFPKEGKFSSIVVGENQDWVFSGASLCGLISAKLGFGLYVSRTSSQIEENTVVLVLDSGEETGNVDVRRIVQATTTMANPEGVLGDSSFRKLEETKPEIQTGAAQEVSSVISRRLRRITRSSS